MNALAYGADGRELLSGAQDGTVRLWDTATGHERRVLKGHIGDVRAVALDAKRGQLASGGDDGSVRIWERSGKPVRVLVGHNSQVICLMFSPDSRRLISSYNDGAVRMWDTAAYDELPPLKATKGMFTAMVFSPDGNLIAAGSDHGVLTLWDGQSLRIVRSITAMRAAWRPSASAPTETASYRRDGIAG